MKTTQLSTDAREALLATLQARFEAHPQRHEGIAWEEVRARLDARPEHLTTLAAMERTGGEPDVVGFTGEAGAIVFCDCAVESPAGRRSLCYDPAALEARKEAKPAGSAVGMAGELGIELLTEAQYHELQGLGAFDLKTSSWLAAPPEVRALGGAIFGDRRYDRVFVSHNGAPSYYASRGFRGLLRI